MKTFFLYVVLIVIGFGLGTVMKVAYQRYQESKLTEQKISLFENNELTEEQEASYRRAHNETLELKAQNQIIQSLKSIEKMLSIAPQRAEPHVLYAETSLELMRWSRGFEVVSEDMANIQVIQAHLLQAKRLAPKDFDVLRLEAHYKDWLGVVARNKDQEDKAVQYLEEAYQIINEATRLYGDESDKFARLLLEKITILYHLKRYDEALEKLNLALENDKLKFMVSQIYFNKALVYADTNKDTLAEKNFTLAIESESGPKVLFYLHRARFYEKRGFTDLALNDYVVLMRLRPEDSLLQKKIDDLREQLKTSG